MSAEAGVRGAVIAVVVAVSMAFGPVAASSADIIGPQDPNDPQVDSPWQAGTCTDDGPPRCSVETPDKFFEQAAGHPPVGFTQFIVNTEPGTLGPVPIGNVRTVRVDIPTGLTVNPQATPQCPLAPEETPANCAAKAPQSVVGTSIVRATSAALLLDGTTVPLPSADVYNIVPEPGEPARFGFSVLGNDVFLETDIAWENDYHEYFTIHAHKLELPVDLGLGDAARIAENRLVFDGTAGNGTFITTPSTCLGPAVPGSPFEHVYSTFLRADSFEEPDPSFPNGSAFVESKIPREPPAFETSPKDCNTIPFDPSIAVDPGTAQTDSPAGAAVTVNLPELQDPGKEEKQASSHVRSARVTLPQGMGLNPSAANGLQACTDAQFGKGTRNPVACPAASRIGTVEVDTPPLPDGSLSGPVYVGQQLSRDPASGNLYRIFVVAESTRYDISARLLGKVSADPQTGQVTTTFDDGALGSIPLPGLPQVPFESFRIKLNGGARATLTSPPTCAPSTTSTQMTPWSGNPPATRSGSFTLSALPGGGTCPKTLGERPFAPKFAARTNKANAGDFSPLIMNVNRADGNQELKGVDVTLPPGISAKLAGVRYCPPAALAAAAANSGAAEAASSSCPASSQIGVADIAAGSGSDPLRIAGKVFLSGPYKGAPLSLAVVTPATAGPFDLGAVVVRVALFVDRRTAQVNAVSDPIPHVYGGALLDIRSVAVRLNRPQFSLNPTNCSKFAFAGDLRGGGSDPLNPAAFSAFPVSAPFEANGCEKLGFKPKLFMRLFGAMKRAKNPRLRAVFVTRDGDANTARAAVTLPRSLILDQSSIAKVCTRPQYDANDCPRKSIYGYARAFTPLLGKPLEGPVFLRSSDNPLPDLVASLRGQVDIDLAGRIDSIKGRIRTAFGTVPDVPVSKFVLTIRGGKKGLLTNTRNQCQKTKQRGKKRVKPLRAIARIKGQNGKKANQRPKLRRPCGGKGKAKRGRG
ncbi:MAG TPA: hypothetical protein VNP96_07365 [Solirubrobacterales bacterium]|nr:hypothetical protein [Solirubrobacterales bacterium]